MVGSFYYIATKGDWVYTSVYDHLRLRKLHKLMQQKDFDEERFKAMEEYVDQLES